jgi:hypothetical protein
LQIAKNGTIKILIMSNLSDGYSLIMNSGIQSFSKIIEINKNDNILPEQLFCEITDDDNDSYDFAPILDYAVELELDKSTKVVIPQHKLLEAGIVNSTGEIIDGNFDSDSYWSYGEELQSGESFGLSEDKGPSEEVGYYYRLTSRDIVDCMANYEGKWLPFPYFRKQKDGTNEFGPYGWCRLLIQSLGEKPKQNEHDDEEQPVSLYKLSFAFDTAVHEDEYSETYFTPKPEDYETGTMCEYSICKDRYLLMKFLSEEYGGEHSYCGWVNDYLKEIYQSGKKDDTIGKGTHFGYAAKFLFLIKYLSSTEAFFEKKAEKKRKEYRQEDDAYEKEELLSQLNNLEISLNNNQLPIITTYSDKHTNGSIDVTLVLDIGNANTCGLLFENSETDVFEFKNVRKLEIKDLSPTHFGQKYEKPFSMRLAFSKAQFGSGKIESIPNYPKGADKAFRWPSMIRIGEEAQRLVNLYNIDGDQKKGETATHCSSPKRYLWDDTPANIPWEYVNNNLSHTTEASYTGISEQFSLGGEFSYQESYGLEPKYSRKSLMTFVYMEIFLHALSQINSHEFRGQNATTPRRLGRVIITCPTALVQPEQIILRKCAFEASLALKRFKNDRYCSEVDLSEDNPEFEIIPSPSDLEKDSEKRKSWNYDEATCSQLVFLYSELDKKYCGNLDVYFEHFGKKEISGKSSITIASLDIGGGTSDLMINYYEGGKSKLKPQPKFWESFTLAGDDLVKAIITAIILEGETVEGGELVGMLKKHANESGCTDVVGKIRTLFGIDQPYNYPRTTYRRNINTQILIPIAIKYLEYTSKEKEEELTFDEIFPKNPPNDQLVAYVDKHFGGTFSFKEIIWKIKPKQVESVVRKEFKKLFGQVSILVQKYQCDYLLISGKITSLPLIRKMFVEYYPISPDRIITMHQYNTGDWYTFSKDGKIQNSKTIVPFGAVIAYMAERGKLGSFALDTNKLKEKVKSTADYVGRLNDDKLVRKMYLTPSRSDYSTQKAGTIPLLLGYKQFTTESYPGKPIYKLVIDKDALKKHFEQLNGVDDIRDVEDWERLIESEEIKIGQSIDEVEFIRANYPEKKEDIKVNIYDENGKAVAKKWFKLKLMTLQDEEKYWADSGEFRLFRNDNN